jgi:hypothetical protein
VPLHVTGGQSLDARVDWAPGRPPHHQRRRNNGIQVGQEFFARRLQKDRDQSVSRETPGTDPHRRLDSASTPWTTRCRCHHSVRLRRFEVGDYLEPFALPTRGAARREDGQARKGQLRRVLSGNDRRQTFGAGEFIVIDRGRDYGIVPGSQFVVYHDKRSRELPVRSRPTPWPWTCASRRRRCSSRSRARR